MSLALAPRALRKPAWFKQEIPGTLVQKNIRLLSGLEVDTICQKAHCPNLSRCFKQGELTFIILGDTCTRNCCFCAIEKAGNKSLKVDDNQPEKIRQAVKKLGLDYVVITSVCRDDLIDGGAGHFSRTIKAVRSCTKDIKVEALIPDFQGSAASIRKVINAAPEVLAHNLETIKRLTVQLRPQADYQRSLNVLKLAKKYSSNIITKSSLMLGLGETRREVIEAMQGLIDAGCDILVLGQYLAPSLNHYPVKEFIQPFEFSEYREIALSLGFKAVASEPLARSSYQAKELYRKVLNA